MIGLGSNRLTVCRRGGMSVTQIGSGGMRLVASPYSAQATAALKDAFTAAQWATIRDYGFRHPEIVGYMNAYAPEDAKIAYSLVEGIGTRWIVGTGTQYINLGSSISNSNGAYFKAKFMPTAFYPGSVSQGYYGVVGENSNPQIAFYADGWSVGNAQSATPYKPQLNHGYICEWNTQGNGNLVIDGTETGLRRAGSLTLKVFYTMSVPCPVAITDIVAKANNYTEIHCVPYKKNGALGMIDLLSGSYYANAGTGTFTELIESPS